MIRPVRPRSAMGGRGGGRHTEYYNFCGFFWRRRQCCGTLLGKPEVNSLIIVRGPQRFESKGANDVKGHKLEIKGKDMFRITLIKFILISTPTNAHTHSQTHTLSGVPFTQYDMLPQHQINIRKLISECF